MHPGIECAGKTDCMALPKVVIIKKQEESGFVFISFGMFVCRNNTLYFTLFHFILFSLV